MLSTSQGYALLRSCCSAEARLLLVGDTAQHSGVEAGDWVRLLSENSSLATVSLTEVHPSDGTELQNSCKSHSQ